MNSKEFHDERALTSVLSSMTGPPSSRRGVVPTLAAGYFLKRSDRDEPRNCVAQSRHKSLNRFGASAVYRYVLVIGRRPNQPWIARVL
jgi:hypothetical protein